MRWWSDESSGIEDGDSGGWEEVIHYLWIFKVFRSYVRTFTIIFLSALLACGLQAFLMMALALPLVQSAFQLAFEILWGRAESKPKRWSRRERILVVSAGRGTKIEEELEETPETGKGKRRYQSWAVENGDAVDRGSQNAGAYGGWDDSEKYGLVRRSSRGKNGSQTMPMEVKLSRREKKWHTSAFELLIGIFPFLGTWTKMLLREVLNFIHLAHTMQDASQVCIIEGHCIFP